MSYPRIYEHVFFHPWAITDAGHAAIVNVLVGAEARKPTQREFALNPADSDLLAATQIAARPAEDIFRNPVEQMTIKDGIARIPVKGATGKHLSAIEKKCGGVSYNDLLDELQAAYANPEVRGILLDINSPGGMTNGANDVADFVAHIQQEGKKQIRAFTDMQCCSAAYWIAAGANGIYATEFAWVGSIGTLIPIIDFSEAYAKSGINVDLIKGGKHKGAGFPGTKMTAEQRQHYQDIVDASFQSFTSHVTKFRKSVSDETMQGQVFQASKAARLGLIDGVVSGIDEVLAKFPG